MALEVTIGHNDAAKIRLEQKNTQSNQFLTLSDSDLDFLHNFFLVTVAKLSIELNSVK